MFSFPSFSFSMEEKHSEECFDTLEHNNRCRLYQRCSAAYLVQTQLLTFFTFFTSIAQDFAVFYIARQEVLPPEYACQFYGGRLIHQYQVHFLLMDPFSYFYLIVNIPFLIKIFVLKIMASLHGGTAIYLHTKVGFAGAQHICQKALKCVIVVRLVRASVDPINHTKSRLKQVLGWITYLYSYKVFRKWQRHQRKREKMQNGAIQETPFANQWSPVIYLPVILSRKTFLIFLNCSYYDISCLLKNSHHLFI